MMIVTIFTPTYNRAYSLSQLYKSLCSQTSSDFEWIIVDDCSSDNTKSLVREWIEEKKISITYFLQPQNGGKHRAINKGVELAKGELFFIVDSDDFLTDDAVESIVSEWSVLPEKQ
ncbi:MAG: glycosyltransferase family 2 protein [Spirochaetaceae bacterium]|nr:glycosyltransferase family 2 protein [Spirochaetaceae bacterium]